MPVGARRQRFRVRSTDPFSSNRNGISNVARGVRGIVLADRVAQADRDVGALMTTGCKEELVAGGDTRAAADILGKLYCRSDLLDRIRQALNWRRFHGE